MAAKASNTQNLKNEYGVPLSDDWRLAHVVAGDQLLNAFEEDNGKDLSAIQQLVLVQLIQAHYMAANVRAKLPRIENGDKTDRIQLRR